MVTVKSLSEMLEDYGDYEVAKGFVFGNRVRSMLLQVENEFMIEFNDGVDLREAYRALVEDFVTKLEALTLEATRDKK